MAVTTFEKTNESSYFIPVGVVCLAALLHAINNTLVRYFDRELMLTNQLSFRFFFGIFFFVGFFKLSAFVLAAAWALSLALNLFRMKTNPSTRAWRAI